MATSLDDETQQLPINLLASSSPPPLLKPSLISKYKLSSSSQVYESLENNFLNGQIDRVTRTPNESLRESLVQKAAEVVEGGNLLRLGGTGSDGDDHYASQITDPISLHTEPLSMPSKPPQQPIQAAEEEPDIPSPPASPSPKKRFGSNGPLTSIKTPGKDERRPTSEYSPNTVKTGSNSVSTSRQPLATVKGPERFGPKKFTRSRSKQERNVEPDSFAGPALKVKPSAVLERLQSTVEPLIESIESEETESSGRMFKDSQSLEKSSAEDSHGSSALAHKDKTISGGPKVPEPGEDTHTSSIGEEISHSGTKESNGHVNGHATQTSAGGLPRKQILLV